MLLFPTLVLLIAMSIIFEDALEPFTEQAFGPNRFRHKPFVGALGILLLVRMEQYRLFHFQFGIQPTPLTFLCQLYRF